MLSGLQFLLHAYETLISSTCRYITSIVQSRALRLTECVQAFGVASKHSDTLKALQRCRYTLRAADTFISYVLPEIKRFVF
jgi:hypothetical protein